MSNLNYTSFVKWHKVYYRLMYWIILIIGAVVCFVKNSGVDKKGYLLSFFFSAGFCYLVTEMLTALNYFESSRVHTVFKFLEILFHINKQFLKVKILYKYITRKHENKKEKRL